MNTTLSTIEQDAFMEIANIGLAKAGDALAMIINEKILIKCVELQNSGAPFSGLDDEHLVIFTEIKGDINVICYFLISKQDATYLISKTLSSNSSDNQFVIDEFNKSFLLESENIISAAVTAQLANLLQMNIYGDIPKLYGLETIKNLDHLHSKFNPFYLRQSFE